MLMHLFGRLFLMAGILRCFHANHIVDLELFEDGLKERAAGAFEMYQ